MDVVDGLFIIAFSLFFFQLLIHNLPILGLCAALSWSSGSLLFSVCVCVLCVCGHTLEDQWTTDTVHVVVCALFVWMYIILNPV